MRIADLPRPVTAAKSDWLPGTTYLGFTPRDGSTNARANCQSTIQKQIGSGLILEYVTQKFDDPNPGFADDPRIVQERIAHAQVAGRLIAVHEVRHSGRALRDIVGHEEYELLQDMWAQREARHRWSVAFPILRTFSIIDKPLAKDVFGEEAYRKLFAYSSGLLRPLNDDHRGIIADLEIEELEAPSAWIAIEDEFERAEASEILPRIERAILHDLRGHAFEGMEEHRRVKVRRRAAYLADLFWKRKLREGKAKCEACGFNPHERLPGDLRGPRSLMDVHHRDPLAEGVRRTTAEDFALLCPTCHRLEHVLLKRGETLLSTD